jgi:hypothetical protein
MSYLWRSRALIAPKKSSIQSRDPHALIISNTLNIRDKEARNYFLD